MGIEKTEGRTAASFDDPPSALIKSVWTFIVGAELTVQSQQRRTTVHDTNSCSQHCLVLEQGVLSWRLNEASDSSGDRRAVGSRSQVLRPYAAKLRWPVDVRVQGCTRSTPETAERDWRRPSVDAAEPAQRGRPSNPAPGRATSAGDQTSCLILYRLISKQQIDEPVVSTRSQSHHQDSSPACRAKHIAADPKPRSELRRVCRKHVRI